MGRRAALRVNVADGTFHVCAPDFETLLNLRKRVEAGAGYLKDRFCIMPPAQLREAMAEQAASRLTLEARQRLARKWPHASAHLELSGLVRWSFAVFLVALIFGVSFAPFVSQPLLGGVALMIVAAPAAIRLFALQQVPKAEAAAGRCPDAAELPRYSVLLPLRDEASMIPQLYSAISRLEYPPEKLEVKFLVESASAETIAAVRPYLRDPRFELIVVPDSLPRTKPKAMNYALPFVTGEHLVVFDAEDRPQSDQLWRAALRFRDNPQLACLQAELVIDNGEDNWLTAMFAGEYAALFGIVLPAHARWRVPVPLGGTSNHFRVSSLIEIGGWDAFNVTEDADLGVRMARKGMRVETLITRTLEAAPSDLEGWMAQRGRWIKGWMLTFIVHNRRPRALLRDLGWRSFLFFELVVLGMILAPILHVFFFSTAVLRLALDMPLVSPSAWLWAVGYFVLFVLGNVAAVVAQFTGLSRLRRFSLLWVQLTLPLYWLLLALATLRALGELLFDPFHWAKSDHTPVSSVSTRDGALSGVTPAEGF
ncbi:glycosyl transferase [Devosia pacifica]|uniref:Glycosyl transferase n=1 Tax=Devosia pacifica TaxID=1335967 RepID=A0A918SAB2_9HYPH|nr:glycosyl transferase [Devosia pacifica]